MGPPPAIASAQPSLKITIAKLSPVISSSPPAVAAAQPSPVKGLATGRQPDGSIRSIPPGGGSKKKD